MSSTLHIMELNILKLHSNVRINLVFMKKYFFVFALIALYSIQTNAQNSITRIVVNTSVVETVEKLIAILDSKGLKVFKVIDHKKGADLASMELLPSMLIIFGNPAVGAKLMHCDQSVGIDLPMKYLVYEDKDGKKWISYWKPTLLSEKYNLEACQLVLTKMDEALAKFASLAAE